MSAILTIGINKKGEQIKIDDAVPGKNCSCFCPICSAPLIAKNKVPALLAKHEHHYAHYKGCPCKANDETVRHLWAKEVLLEEKSLGLPEGNGRIPSGLVRFQNVEVEMWNKVYGFRPDAVATLENGEKLLIEFLVSHKVTAKKRKIIADNNLNCIEIDLNHVELDKDAIKSFLLNDTYYKEWIGLAENNEVRLHREGFYCEECYHEDSYKEENIERRQEWVLSQTEEEYWEEEVEQYNTTEHPLIIVDTQEKIYVDPEQRSCFNCKKNLDWANRDGWANCGPYISKGLPGQRVDPNLARFCRQFEPKVNWEP